jgi:sortase A
VSAGVSKGGLRQILKWSQRVLFACAIVLLGYCGLSLTSSWLFQRRASQNLDRQLRDRRIAGALRPQPASVAAPRSPEPATGSLIGRIEITRLRLSVMVVEGVDKANLRRAVGHIPGTALPGEAGNVGLAAHRDTYFRRLKDVKIGDRIQLATLKGIFKYEVVSLRVVEQDNIEVLAPSGENVVTLVTCYPFYFVGPAPKRWIVRARQVSSQAVTASTVK